MCPRATRSFSTLLPCNFGLGTARPQADSFLSSQIRRVHLETEKIGSPITKITPPTYTLNRHRRRHQSETRPSGACSRILGNRDSMLKRLFCGWIEQLKPFSSLQTLSPPFLTNPALRCPNCKLRPQPSESYNQSNRTTWSLCRLCARLNRNSSIFVTLFGPQQQPPTYHAQR